MIMKTCSSLLCRLQPPHPWHCWQRLTAAFISSSAFLVCFSDTAPGILLRSPPRVQRIWNNFPFSVHMLNSDSPNIPPTSSLENLRIAVWLRACRKKSLGIHIKSSLTEWHFLFQKTLQHTMEAGFWIYKTQMRTTVYMGCLLGKI